MEILCSIFSDWKSPALLCVLRWSVWNKRWNRRGRSNACWRSNFEIRSERVRMQRTVTGFWRRRWRISFPHWGILPWAHGRATYDTFGLGQHCGCQGVSGTHVLLCASGCFFKRRFEQEKKEAYCCTFPTSLKLQCGDDKKKYNNYVNVVRIISTEQF